MQVTISGPHVEITDTLREYVWRKLTRIDRHSGPVIRAHAVLHVATNRHRVETTVHTKGAQWHATAENRDMYATIDRAVEKLDRQEIKHKKKAVDHHKEGGRLKNRPNT